MATTPLPQPFPWPNSARAAVCLTYDDGMNSQLDLAGPALAEFGLHGTFFVSNPQGAVTARMADWAALGAQGNELAGHTLIHPCRGGRSWLKPGNALEDFDEARMLGELRGSDALLESLGAKGPYSYAYTCGETELGQPARSYVPLVRGHYAAARGVKHQLCDPWNEDLHLVSAVHGHLHDGPGLISVVEEAARQGSWAVFMFHGVDEGSLSVSAQAHRELLRHLAKNPGTFWAARFIDAAAEAALKRGPA